MASAADTALDVKVELFAERRIVRLTFPGPFCEIYVPKAATDEEIEQGVRDFETVLKVTLGVPEAMLKANFFIRGQEEPVI